MKPVQPANDVMLQFHSILELVPLLERFMQWTHQHVDFDEMHFHHHEHGLFEALTISENQRGHVKSHIPLGHRGKLYFLRGSEFTTEEESALRACAGNLLRPLNNALQYHNTQLHCERLTQRLEMSNKTCTSLSRINHRNQHITIDDLISHHELSSAINSDALTVFYQPKVDLKSGNVTGLEALVRWHHQDRGLLSPEQFIPLAEHHGLTPSITLWVLNTVLRQCADWKQQGLLVPVAVNLSIHDLERTDLPEYMEKLLTAWDIPGEYIELEITETAAIKNPEQSRYVLERLSALGVTVAIDDFGIGYSSLHRLKHLPVHTIKIDKSFVMDAEQSDRDSVLIDSITRLGHQLGMKVVAEGVDSHEGWQRIQACGCDMAQGFHISRPLSDIATTGWLRNSIAQPAPAMLH